MVTIDLSVEDWELLSLILYHEISDGGQLPLIRKYINLYDKIEKELEENTINE